MTCPIQTSGGGIHAVVVATGGTGQLTRIPEKFRFWLHSSNDHHSARPTQAGTGESMMLLPKAVFWSPHSPST